MYENKFVSLPQNNKYNRIMKKVLNILMCLLLIVIFAGCSKDDDSNDISHNESCISGDTSLYKEILGEWELVKAIPEGNTFNGIDYFCFYPDGSYTYHYNPESKTYQRIFEIIERDNWDIPTIDYKHIPTNYYLRLLRGADFCEDFPFVIEGNLMHINIWGYTYFFTAFMFERVK